MALSSYFSTRTEFESSLQNFYEETEACLFKGTQWTWETQPILKHVYIKRKSFIVSNTRPKPPPLEEDLLVVEELDPAAVDIAHSEMIQLEHHVVYSTSYQVPVLYFRALYEDGTPLSLQEVYQQVVPDMYHDQVIITQTEHPLLGTPFWFIHPCDTRKLMNTIQFEYRNYIKTWLSFNGPVVRCQIPKELFGTVMDE